MSPADPSEGLRLAVEEVERNPPPRMSIVSHPLSFAMLSELYADRDRRQGRGNEPAALSLDVGPGEEH